MANAETIARPYAKAAFAVARSEHALDSWQDMLKLAGVFADTPEIRALSNRPGFDRNQLVSWLQEIGTTINWSPTQRNFIQTVVDNRRLGVLSSVAEQFTALALSEQQTLEADVTSAQPLSDEAQHHIAQALQQRFGQQVVMKVSIDEDLIGGVVIRVGDTVIDASIQGKISRFATQLDI
jgi:F-type H+-transporting ATPase subunit delta